MPTLKQPFKSETRRLEHAIAEIRKSGEIAPDGCWLSAYRVRKILKSGDTKHFQYFKVMSDHAIFQGKQGMIRHLHLGAVGSPAYQDWSARIDRRNQLQRLTRELERLQRHSQTIKGIDLPSPNATKPSDCWRTPNTAEFPILDLVGEVLGGIGLDPVADDARSVPARHHFTAADDCLVQSWEGLGAVFLNPPFSKPEPFIRKLSDEYQSSNIPAAIALCKSGVISNQGTGKLIQSSATGICFWNARRIGYLDDSGQLVDGADFDSVLIYWGCDFERFRAVFSPYGTVVPVVPVPVS